MRDVDTRDLDRYAFTRVESGAGLEEEPQLRNAGLASRALGHLRRTRERSGLVEAEPMDFVVDPHVQVASSGAASVHAQQTHLGIPLFQADSTVLFAPDGSLLESLGTTVDTADEPTIPAVTALDAVGAVVDFLNRQENRAAEPDPFGQTIDVLPELTTRPTAVITAFPGLPERPTVVEPGPFEGDGIGVHLVWVPAAGTLRLAWMMELHLPAGAGSVLVLVDARDASIRYAVTSTQGLGGRASVYTSSPDRPRTTVPLPVPLTAHAAKSATPLPAGFPFDWLTAGRTDGTSVLAVDSTRGTPVDGLLSGGTVTFDEADPEGADQQVVNLFYFCCLMHDLFYVLGFREPDGNFQVEGLGNAGLGNDIVIATAYPGAVSATANMTTPRDGSRPRLNVGLLTRTGRHTALDATVVIHEYSHGVTSRLVGGPLNASSLLAPQSAGMSEGWSDYLACAVCGTDVIGAWVSDQPDGIRRHRYGSGYPGTFADLGTSPYSDKHEIGELWCAVLMEFDRRVGSALALQVVVDSLKLVPANPGLLEARDGMIRALDSMVAAGSLAPAAHEKASSELQAVVGRFGMGPGAQSSGAQLTGIVADFVDLEQQAPRTVTLSARPASAIPDKDQFGVLSTLVVDAGSGTVETVRVSVDVAHEFRGDLHIALISPAGTRVVLRESDPDPGVDLVATYDAGSAPGLATLRGEPAAGPWRLRVADLARLSTGVFRSWTLAVSVR